MLAYVFWHWARPDVDRHLYEAALRSFHDGLRAEPSAGFLGSAVFRVEGAPWMGPQRRCHEDWYLVSGSAALDPLNQSAVSGARRDPHHATAAGVAGMCAGLYGLQEGGGEVGAARHSAWITKPKGVAYADFYARLRPLLGGRGAGLWRRQMVLGPTPEFCLLSDESLELEAGLSALEVKRELVYPVDSRSPGTV